MQRTRYGHDLIKAILAATLGASLGGCDTATTMPVTTMPVTTPATVTPAIPVGTPSPPLMPAPAPTNTVSAATEPPVPAFVGDTHVACEQRGLSLPDLKLATAVDYIEENQPMAGPGGRRYGARRATGTRCKTKNPATCEKKLASLAAKRPEWPRPDTRWLTTQAGIAKATTLRALLGPIDTATEAYLLLGSEWGGVDCAARVHKDGFVLRGNRMVTDCPIVTETADVLVRGDGRTEVLAVLATHTSGACAGRRAPQVVEHTPGSRAPTSKAAAWVADVARLEAEAVFAFAQLHRELVALDAPPRLLAQVKRAIADEVRHARDTSALTVALGGEAPRVVAAEIPLRSVAAIAFDNVVEGCVRETWGALVASVQAQRAKTPALRALFAQIAADETAHAGLAIELHDWLRTRAGAPTDQELEGARREATASLRREVEAAAPVDDDGLLGLPTKAETRDLFTNLFAALSNASSGSGLRC